MLAKFLSPTTFHCGYDVSDTW